MCVTFSLALDLQFSCSIDATHARSFCIITHKWRPSSCFGCFLQAACTAPSLQAALSAATLLLKLLLLNFFLSAASSSIAALVSAALLSAALAPVVDEIVQGYDPILQKSMESSHSNRDSASTMKFPMAFGMSGEILHLMSIG
ncbi:hypothetical protein M9H77_08150 [Catharanthus roseus]|uniref:Uncharacterized protein n=1 Tax=Catharanthus roseus TaxID=4058 RepID=A0ACC0BX00_CATRO|nr:hypothetical protein M9H77_08150 [Catharanthus roseus]